MFNSNFILAYLYASIFSCMIAAGAYFFDGNTPEFWAETFKSVGWFLFLNVYLKRSQEKEEKKND